MISTTTEYAAAQDQLTHLESWLERLRRDHPLPEKGMVRCGIRKLISRLHKEMADYEGALDSQPTVTPELEEVGT